MDRFRVWADVYAPTAEDAELELRRALDAAGHKVGATGKTEHQGWRNYETFTVNLWLANDRRLHDLTRARVRGVSTTAPRSEWNEQHRHDVARMLEQWIGGMMPDLSQWPGPRGMSCASTLLASAVAEVDWLELADEWIRNVAEVPA